MILDPWQEIWPCLAEAQLHLSVSKCIIQPNSESAVVLGKIRCFPESTPMVFLTCPCVNLWDGGVHSDLIKLRRVTLSIRESSKVGYCSTLGEYETASAQCTLGLHIPCCTAQLNLSLNMFERVTEQRFCTIPLFPFYTRYYDDVWIWLCHKIMRKQLKNAALFKQYENEMRMV